ncbi:MAG: hypothetical protein HOE62_22515 [Alphaproteobacteria bacterium]|nr:hypothetical protein [Alphaproteobacteria bacterium]MBT5160954.1 hypothetical protein [Alphaproteobacteria bacterium]MBT7744511.1 hypothetical protein [Alphaproteobacteria bacterium]
MFKQDLEDYKDVLARKFFANGLTLTVNDDFELMDGLLMEHAAEDFPGGPSPLFSPEFNCMTPDRSFWLGLETEDGQLVTTVAAKKFDFVENVEELWSSLRILYDDDSKPTPADQIIIDTRFPPGLEGTISTTGRGWTRSDYRRRGLVRDLVVLARAECLGRWLIDWHIGTTTAGHIEGGREVSCFAYDPKKNVDRLGIYLKSVGAEKTLHLHMLWMGPDEIAALVKTEVSRLNEEFGQVAAE